MNQDPTAPATPARAEAYLHFGGSFTGTPNGSFLTIGTIWHAGNVKYAGKYYQVWERNGTLYIRDRHRNPIATVQLMNPNQ